MDICNSKISNGEIYQQVWMNGWLRRLILIWNCIS